MSSPKTSSVKGLMTTKEVNEALMNASRRMILDQNGLIGVPEQELQEVMFSLLEKTQVLAEVLAKSGDKNAAWLHKKLHELTEEFDLMEISEAEEREYEKDFIPDAPEKGISQ